MTSPLLKYYWSVRRFLLKNLVPEFVWPKEVILDGVSIKIRNTPYSFGARYILKKGEYEVAERKLLAHIIKPGDIIIEMGGSIGVLTSIIGKMTGSSGKVFSVEASKRLTAYSAQWLEQKGNIKVLTGFGFPVYTCNENLQINSFDESQGSLGGIVSFETGASSQKNNSGTGIIYDIKTIADSFNILPDVLVVDIEGSEKIMLDDNASFMDSIKYILIELHPHLYGEKIKEDIILKILAQGYKTESSEGNIYLFKALIQKQD